MEQEHSLAMPEGLAPHGDGERGSGASGKPGTAGHDPSTAYSHSTRAHYLLSPRALLCVGAAVWIASVSMSSRGLAEATPWRTVSQARWETSCPGCGTVESVSQIQEARGQRSWRVDVRTSGGWLRPFHSETALAPGQRVMVDGDRVRPAEAPSCR